MKHNSDILYEKIYMFTSVNEEKVSSLCNLDYNLIVKLFDESFEEAFYEEI